MKKTPQERIGMRISPQTARIILPIRHRHDLPQLARELEALAWQLKAIHQNENQNDNAALFHAWTQIRHVDRKLKRIFPE